MVGPRDLDLIDHHASHNDALAHLGKLADAETGGRTATHLG
jgi:hypothetical protein